MGIEDPATQIAKLLGETARHGALSVKRTLKPDDLRIVIDGLGALQFPLSAAQVKLLRIVSKQARYGQGERTLVDCSVRDTWEVPTSLVQIDEQRWNTTLAPMLTTLRSDLGCPKAAGSRPSCIDAGVRGRPVLRSAPGFGGIR